MIILIKHIDGNLDQVALNTALENGFIKSKDEFNKLCKIVKIDELYYVQGIELYTEEN